MKRKNKIVERLRGKDVLNAGNKIFIKRTVLDKEGYGLHSHDFFEIEIILSGKAVHVLNGENLNLNKGAVYFMTPSDCHKYISVEQDIELLDIVFDMAFIDEKIIFDIINKHPQVINITNEEDLKFISSLCMRIFSYRENFIYRDIYMKSLLECVILSLFRLLSDSPVAYNIDNAEQSAVQKILIYIHSYFKENITLGDISAYTKLTKTYLCDVFKSAMSKTILEYITELRLTYSTKLLGEYNNLSVSEICYECGYNTLSHFLRDFKKHYKKSPLKYKNSKNLEINHSQSENLQ